MDKDEEDEAPQGDLWSLWGVLDLETLYWRRLLPKVGERSEKNREQWETREDRDRPIVRIHGQFESRSEDTGLGRWGRKLRNMENREKMENGGLGTGSRRLLCVLFECCQINRSNCFDAALRWAHSS